MGGFMEILEQDFEQVTRLQIYPFFYPEYFSVFFSSRQYSNLICIFPLSSGLTIGRLYLPPIQSSVTSSMSCSMAQLLSEPIMNQEVDLSSVSSCDHVSSTMPRRTGGHRRLHHVLDET